jgi:hypothetical protein
VAGDWIKMRHDLTDDPAVVRIADILQVDEDLVIGKLHRLWSWADRQTADGTTTGISKAWIDRHVRCPGFAEAMCSVKWLIADGDSISFPSFEKHNGESAKRRSRDAIRQRVSRKTRDNEPDKSQRPVHDLSHKKCDNVVTNSGHLTDKSVTREEKRKEEKKESKEPPLPPETGGEVRSGKFEPRTVAIPQTLDVPEFRDAWQRWCQHRAERKPKLTPESVSQQLRDLASWGLQKALVAIDTAIRSGWQGLFEPKPAVMAAVAPHHESEAEKRRRERDIRLGVIPRPEVPP